MPRRKLVLGLFLWGILTVNGNSTEPVGLRLVGGDGRCRGELQVQRSGQDWTAVKPGDFPLFGHRACAELDCGPALTMAGRRGSEREMLGLRFCNDTSLIHCFDSETHRSRYSLELNCSVTGSSLLLRALVLLLLQPLNFIPYFYYRRQATRGSERTGRARGHRASPEDERTDVAFHQM